MRVAASGVRPWDALIREEKSVVKSTLPLTLGSDDVYGVTNKQFIGANAEYALASAEMIARKPTSLNFVDAASAPVVAVTAWQMFFENARQAGRGDPCPRSRRLRWRLCDATGQPGGAAGVGEGPVRRY